MKQRVMCVFFIIFILCSGACSKKETSSFDVDEPFSIDAQLFLYEGTEEAEAIAVDEEGYLYTSTCISEIKAGQIDTSNYVYEPLIQKFQVYDLEGNCIKEVEVGIGDGAIEWMIAKQGKLYCIVMKSALAHWGPTLYTIDTKTWEVTELYQFEDYSSVKNFAHVGDYFYIIGRLKEVPNKEYDVLPDVRYTYQGECISRIKVGEEQPKEERLPIDFPIDIVETKEDTLLIYHYNEEKGFGFLEFSSKEQVLQEIGFQNSKNPRSCFTKCENGFLFCTATDLYYGTENGLEVGISEKDVFIGKVPIYQRGFVFYINYTNGTVVERLGIAELIKTNTPIHLLVDMETTTIPFACGYQMKKQIPGLDVFALKVLAQDSDFDLFVLYSRYGISNNIKEKGSFYALNEVDGVQEYLDVCFPYLKETAMNEEGDIWMIPIALDILGLHYHKQFSADNGVDLTKMNFDEFLVLIEQIESSEIKEQGMLSDYMLIENFLQQYVSLYDNFDTDVFRIYAKKIKDLTDKVEVDYDALDIYAKMTKDYFIDLFYEVELSALYTNFLRKKLDTSDAIGVAGMPKISEDIGNMGMVTLLAVNPNSENLDVTLDYISDLCHYMMNQKDTFLLADESMYTDTPYIKEWYELYKGGSICFTMESDIYWNTFWDYIDGEVELEDMIEEIERKRKIYMEE